MACLQLFRAHAEGQVAHHGIYVGRRKFLRYGSHGRVRVIGAFAAPQVVQLLYQIGAVLAGDGRPFLVGRSVRMALNTGWKLPLPCQ